MPQRFAPALTLAWTFLYLLFFRLAAKLGLPSPTPFANAIQLLLTLKVEKLDQIKRNRINCGAVRQVHRSAFPSADGELSQRGAKLPHGEEEGGELLWEVR